MALLECRHVERFFVIPMQLSVIPTRSEGSHLTQLRRRSLGRCWSDWHFYRHPRRDQRRGSVTIFGIGMDQDFLEVAHSYYNFKFPSVHF
jgi:hypothetical protein